MTTTKIALTIAGSDSAGGAGIQADLRTFAFHRVHGASVITCVTAQNTVGVKKVEAISLATIAQQIEAVTEDLQVDAVKTGMLLDRAIIEVVSSYNFKNLVLDPVMVSRSGAQLIDDLADFTALNAIRFDDDYRISTALPGYSIDMNSA